MEKEENEFELPRSLYKEIKSMNRDQMQKVISDIYEKGTKSVESGSVDVACLRTEIGKINGIGENALMR